MDKVFLFREHSSPQGTKGLWVADGFSCKSFELPWKNNAPNISCIPTGSYVCQPRYSKKYGRHYHITNVDGRSWILTHSGNLAGDINQGFKSHTAGCILLGKYFGKLNGQDAVLLSRTTLRRFITHMDWKPFELIIRKV